MNYLAPSGTPITAKHLFKWLTKTIWLRINTMAFKSKILATIKVEHCLFISSGRTALYLLLKSLHELTDNKTKNEVIVPSYTCFSVPGSVAKAGLKIRVCDVDKDSLSYNLGKLENQDYSNVLAIVTANLYGIPNDLPEIEKIAKKHNVYLIDDAAQSFGASVDGRPSGTFGDSGIYSLDKGKNITSIQGGIIVTNSSQISSKLESCIRDIPKQSIFSVSIDILKLLIYAYLLPPTRYWLITKLPYSKIGLTPYTTDYPVHKYSNALAGIASLLYDELPVFNKIRASNANKLQIALRDLNDLQHISIKANAKPVYLRYPILIRDPDKRRLIVQELNMLGIGATTSYPTSVVDIPEISDLLVAQELSCAMGNQIAAEIVTLPTHPYTTDAHISTIIDVLKRHLD